MRLLWQTTLRPRILPGIEAASHMPWQMIPLRTVGSSKARRSSSVAGASSSTFSV